LSAKLYIISLGPGKPELITIQALQALIECDIILVPTRSKEPNQPVSVAYNIIEKVFDKYGSNFADSTASSGNSTNWKDKIKTYYTSMNYSSESWDSQVNDIIEAYNSDKKVGYVTLGDAGIYSSAYYLLNIIKEKYSSVYDNTEVIAGITSFSYASAMIKKPLCLGDSGLNVIPMHAESSEPGKVYMRFHKGDKTDTLKGKDLYFCKNLGMEDESCEQGLPETITHYLSLVIDFAREEKQQ